MASEIKGMQSRKAAAMVIPGLVIPAELRERGGRVRVRVWKKAEKAKGRLMVLLWGEVEGEDMVGALHTEGDAEAGSGIRASGEDMDMVEEEASSSHDSSHRIGLLCGWLSVCHGLIHLQEGRLIIRNHEEE